MTAATLHLHEKKVFENGSVLEMKLWEVKPTGVYPEGIKYSLIFIDTGSDKKLLMDNHSPKGHHYHINDEQFEYKYVSIEKLIDDFRSLVNVHMGVNL